MNYALIPQPHRVRFDTGTWCIPRRGMIGIADQSLYSVAQAAQALLPNHTCLISTPRSRNSMTIDWAPESRPGSYRLFIGARGIRLSAHSPAAAFHGLQTLRQIASQAPAGTLPHLRIDDWPDFAERGVYYDVCRGRVPKLDELLKQVRLLATYKINHFQLYIEHTFLFRGHPTIGRDASPLTPEDILALDRCCIEHGIELVPSLASFGHLNPILRQPEYHHLAEDWGVGRYEDPEHEQRPAWQRTHTAWTLSPAEPRIYPFLDSLFAEFLPLFVSKRFNVCCDETWDLGLGRSYAMCRKLGKGRVYLNHILKLRELAAKYGKTIMFWGDIIRHYPELISDIPTDVAVLDWAYHHNHTFDTIVDFKNAGLDFFACPGTNAWNALFPRVVEANENIHGFAVAGRANGARGLLNTDWGDGGHFNFMELSWPGYLFGAEQAWNIDANRKNFPERFCRLFLGSGSTALRKAFTELSEIASWFVWGNSSVWYSVFFAAPGEAIFEDKVWDMWQVREGRMASGKTRLDAAFARSMACRLNVIHSALKNASKPPGADPHRVLSYWLFAVDTMLHAANKVSILGSGRKPTGAERRTLHRELSGLRKRLIALWLARNRHSEIGITLKRYDRVLKALALIVPQ